MAEQRGRPVTVRARIREAEVVTPPDLDDPAALAALGLSATMTEAVQTVADDLRVEAEVDATTATREAVFEALLAEVPAEVDEGWIDAGLGAAFAHAPRARWRSSRPISNKTYARPFSPIGSHATSRRARSASRSSCRPSSSATASRSPPRR